MLFTSKPIGFQTALNPGIRPCISGLARCQGTETCTTSVRGISMKTSGILHSQELIRVDAYLHSYEQSWHRAARQWVLEWYILYHEPSPKTIPTKEGGGVLRRRLKA
jgi:hypothetical protein